MRKGIKQQKPIIFVQDTGVYTDQILVCAGASKKDVIAFNKKKRAIKPFQEWLKNETSLYQEAEKNEGIYAQNDDVQGSVLMLRPFEDKWDYWEVLIHELHHAVEFLAKRKAMQEETEAKAYLQGYLFRSIRRKFSGIDPK
jgi:hypothetical protein